MKATRSYRSRNRAMGAQHTRERIVTAVRELMREQRFHESTVEQVAERAGVSRATVYQHFRSRIDLVDAICETFDANPALIELRRAIMLPDPRAALTETNVNLYAGIFMLGFGGIMLWLSRRKTS